MASHLETALWTMAFIGVLWLITMVGGLSAEAAHDGGINPLWPEDTCPPPFIYKDESPGLLWLHGNRCTGIDLKDYSFTAQGGCEVSYRTPLWHGTAIRVRSAIGQPCVVHAFFNPAWHDSAPVYLGNWTFSEFYVGPMNGPGAP